MSDKKKESEELKPGKGGEELKIDFKAGKSSVFNQEVYAIDFDKVKTLEDVILILKSLEIRVHVYSGITTDAYNALNPKGLLKRID